MKFFQMLVELYRKFVPNVDSNDLKQMKIDAQGWMDRKDTFHQEEDGRWYEEKDGVKTYFDNPPMMKKLMYHSGQWYGRLIIGVLFVILSRVIADFKKGTPDDPDTEEEDDGGVI